MTTNPIGPSTLFSHLTGRAVEAFSLWADANQKVLRELVDLSASTAKEGVRLYAEIQSSAVEAAKEGQGVLESVEGAQRTCKLFEGKLFEGTAQAMTRSAERLQVTAEQTGKEIQAAYIQLAGKVQSLSTSA
ncbi:MAG: hypothetical protein ACREJS_06640 [Candidatus Rokuibacteriota bacterium]